jgi:hypothetical protein
MRFWKHLTVAAALVVAGCGFSPTSPFEGFDENGTRVRGSFDSALTAQDTEVRASAASPQGIRVSLKERRSLSIVVGGDGQFALTGLPSGSWSLVFERDGQVVGEIRFRSVRKHQEITIVVALTSDGEVVLLQEARDRVSFEGECPRGAGFWCQNQGGKNPNLSAEEFQKFAEEAAGYFGELGALDTPGEIAGAVCNSGDQLLRQLATLALNLAAKTLERSTGLTGEPYSTVGAAFDAAVAAAANPGTSRDERNRIKDVLERINESQNTATTCDTLPDDDEDDGDDGDGEVPPGGKITICHIPPGNPAKAKTLTIGASAWPAHKAHGDTLGACPGK